MGGRLSAMVSTTRVPKSIQARTNRVWNNQSTIGCHPLRRRAWHFTRVTVPAGLGDCRCALAAQHLTRLVVKGEAVIAEEHLLGGLGERIRDVRQGPDGLLYLLTDSATGRVLRLRPSP
jgi:glucose/arabinose dehydrogenase